MVNVEYEHMSEKTPHIAVTGAAGYIGSRVVNQLQEVHPEWQITAQIGRAHV